MLCASWLCASRPWRDRQLQLVLAVQLLVAQLGVGLAGKRHQLHFRLDAILDLLRQLQLFVGRQQRVAADVAQVHAHRVETLADLLDVGDQLFDRDVLLLLDLFFQLGVAFDARDGRGVFLRLLLFRHVGKEILLGRLVRLPQVDIFVEFTFAAARAAGQRRDRLQVLFRVFVWRRHLAWFHHQ